MQMAFVFAFFKLGLLISNSEVVMPHYVILDIVTRQHDFTTITICIVYDFVMNAFPRLLQRVRVPLGVLPN